MLRSTPLLLCQAALLIDIGTTPVCAEAPKPVDQPNVIFILTDDLGYREVGSFGQELIRTPHLDELCTQGMKLTQHYSGNAVCAPSRCVLMSGKHPGHAFIRNNKAAPPEGQWPIPDEEVTLGELMQQQGYVTGGFGTFIILRGAMAGMGSGEFADASCHSSTIAGTSHTDSSVSVL